MLQTGSIDLTFYFNSHVPSEERCSNSHNVNSIPLAPSKELPTGLAGSCSQHEAGSRHEKHA